MLRPQRILLASHGTTGAHAAAAAALALSAPGGTFLHLTVVPDFWRGMMGDDWLNNVATRDAYCRHVETQLAREVEMHQRDVEVRVLAAGGCYSARVVLGKPADCLLQFATETSPQLVVIGSPRPSGVAGLRSRMHVETLVKGLAAPLLVVPYPG